MHRNSLFVWIGPSISQANFEVSADMIDQFKGYERFFKPHQAADKYLLDLSGVAIEQLAELGVSNVQKSTTCTYDSDDCYSHRAANHSGIASTGRMATVVVRV
jgi:hypothetical protein